MALVTHPSGLIAELDIHELADLLRDLEGEGEAPALAVSEAAPPAPEENEKETSNR